MEWLGKSSRNAIPLIQLGPLGHQRVNGRMTENAKHYGVCVYVIRCCISSNHLQFACVTNQQEATETSV